MKIYNEDKTQILESYDDSLGWLKQSSIVVNEPEVQAVEEQGHYETIAEYQNGGKEVKWVVDVEAVEYKPARTYDEAILVYIPYTQYELENIKIEELRRLREIECFPIVNRGVLWYNELTSEQLEELENWYKAWLDVTDTKTAPQKPEWLK